MATDLKTRIDDDMKSAMRAKDKERLGAIRLIKAAIQQNEVDSRKTLDDTGVLTIIDKMAKQRRESIEQFKTASRTDLVDKEQFELDILIGYLPEQLDDDAIAALIDKAIADTGAASMKDMGKVMGILKPELQGRADMGAVSGRIKARLS